MSIDESSSLKEIIHDAINQVDTYKHPDLEIFRKRINAISEAAQLGSTGGDTITRITWSKDQLSIDTEYYCRNCHQTNEINIPNSILNASNPVLAAKEYRKNLDIANAIARIEQVKYNMKLAEENLIQVKQKYGIE